MVQNLSYFWKVVDLLSFHTTIFPHNECPVLYVDIEKSRRKKSSIKGENNYYFGFQIPKIWQISKLGHFILHKPHKKVITTVPKYDKNNYVNYGT